MDSVIPGFRGQWFDRKPLSSKANADGLARRQY
jgi:hypothetical protein